MSSTEEPQSTLQHGSFEGQGTADRFCLSLTNSFQALQELYEDSSTDLEAKWEHARQMWTSTCEEVVGGKAEEHKARVTPPPPPPPPPHYRRSGKTRRQP